METADSAVDAPGKKPRIAFADGMQEAERQFEALIAKMEKVTEVQDFKFERVTMHFTFGANDRKWVTAIKVHRKHTDEVFMSINANPDVAITDSLKQFETWISLQHSKPVE